VFATREKPAAEQASAELSLELSRRTSNIGDEPFGLVEECGDALLILASPDCQLKTG
jgi:hypothetical protein